LDIDTQKTHRLTLHPYLNTASIDPWIGEYTFGDIDDRAFSRSPSFQARLNEHLCRRNVQNGVPLV